jgi:hypothetical protein
MLEHSIGGTRVKKKLRALISEGRLIQKGDRYYDISARRWATFDICRSVYKAGWTKVWRLMSGFIVDEAYTPKGEHIGPSALAYRLIVGLRIWPETGLMAGRATIGYSRLDGAWYGWSATRGLKRCGDRGAALLYGVDE